MAGPAVNQLTSDLTPEAAGTLTALGAAAISLAIALMLTAFGCVGGEEAGTTARMPTESEEIRLYADCVLGDSFGGYEGSNFRGQTRPQLQSARCRLLEPAATGVTTPEEFRNCQEDQLGWITRKYQIPGSLKGLDGLAARVYLETVCAPEPAQPAGLQEGEGQE